MTHMDSTTQGQRRGWSGRGRRASSSRPPDDRVVTQDRTGTPLGIDPSLAATGVSTGWMTRTLKPPGTLRGRARHTWILAELVDLVAKASLVVIEGPSYGSTKAASSAHERAGLWWKIDDLVHEQGKELYVASPSSVKKYATGKGNADKDAVMLATARRFDWFAGDNNAADAQWLAAIGYELAGTPLLEMPAVHREALKGVSLHA